MILMEIDIETIIDSSGESLDRDDIEIIESIINS